MSEAWQPIETAPKDEAAKLILLYAPTPLTHPEDWDSHVHIGGWCEAGGYGDNEGFWYDWAEGFTREHNGHEEWAEVRGPKWWMPLPPPPSQST